MIAILMFRVDGEPVSKERPRLGRGGNVYTPDKTKSAEDAVGWAFKIAARGHKVDDTKRYAISMTFALTPGKGHGRRDLDNLVKVVLDGLNGVAYKDDSQVDELTARKLYIENDEKPGIAIAFSEIAEVSDIR